MLERSEQYRDRVRGEDMAPWRCLELVQSGLLDVSLPAEGQVSARCVPYGDSLTAAGAEARAVDTTVRLPGAAGMLDLSHPGACPDLVTGLRRGDAAFARFAADPVARLPIAAALVGTDRLPRHRTGPLARIPLPSSSLDPATSARASDHEPPTVSPGGAHPGDRPLDPH